MDEINFNNVSINLKTFHIEEKKKDEKIFKINCNFVEDSQKAKIFLKKYFKDEQMLTFVQVFLGYLLSNNNTSGDVFCFYGPNNSGKSTLFKLFSSFFNPYFGSFSFMIVQDLISNKDRVKVFRDYFENRRVNLVDGVNKSNIRFLLPFLKMKVVNNYEVPNNSKILAFASGVDQDILNEYGSMAFFIPLRIKFNNVENNFSERLLNDEKLRQSFHSFAVEGAKMFYSSTSGLNDFIPL